MKRDEAAKAAKLRDQSEKERERKKNTRMKKAFAKQYAFIPVRTWIVSDSFIGDLVSYSYASVCSALQCNTLFELRNQSGDDSGTRHPGDLGVDEIRASFFDEFNSHV